MYRCMGSCIKSSLLFIFRWVPSALMRIDSIGSGAVALEAVGVATLGMLVTPAGGATWGILKL